MPAFSLKASFIVMGASGIVAQVVLLRELLISFLGNEFTLGIILANWLIIEAIGSFFVGRTAEKMRRKLEFYVGLQLFFSIAFPFSIYLCRTFKNFLLLTPGEGMGFAPVFYSSFFILVPVSLVHGALFSFGCQLHSQYSRNNASSIGKVYIFETLGSIGGGVFITFWLIQHLHSFDIALLISSMNAVISIFLLWIEDKSFPRPNGVLWFFSVILSLLFIYMLFSPLSEKIHQSSIHWQWKGLNPIHYENSVYGNITVTQKGKQFTFFVDGVPSITTPMPDIASIEDVVHFSMLFHERPESVLVLSGGAGGMINEILKYPVRQVDYVELDPILLKLIREFSTPLTQFELSDPRVNVHYADGRFFVKKTACHFDIIFIGLSAPQELQANRLFSSEFFSLAKKKMNEGGILVLTLPGSLTYISQELRNLNGCIWDTLKGAFKFGRVIPGDVNLYFASDSEKLVKATSEEIVKTFEEKGIATSLFTPAYIDYRLHPRWSDWFLKSMEREEVHINSDFRPLAVFFSLSYWNALFSPYLSKLFDWVKGLNLGHAFFFTAFLTVILSMLFLKKRPLARYSFPYAIFTSGFADMMIELAIIFNFQSLYGYLYHQIGLLITLFMVGIAFSSFLITRRIEKIQKDSLLFLGSEISLVLFCLLLPTVFSIPSSYLDKTAVNVIFYATFLLMSFLCGALVGLQFPLAAKIYLRTYPLKKKVSHTAGLLYGADLAGGFLGGLWGGVFLLPVLGLKESCYMMAILKISSFLLIVLFTRTQK